MLEADQIKYRAFLSYSHADSGIARRAHARLESFRIDKELIGRKTPQGPIPTNLRPIFRDREDFAGGSSLNEATIAALDASAALIVLCSTVSAGRPAVNEEIRLFRARHPDRLVIPVIVEGTWPENFPPALRFELDADGAVSTRPMTILGPDLREAGDGMELGLAKIVAPLIGLAPDDVYRRAERLRRKQARWRNGVIAVLALLAVTATGSALYAWHELQTNEKFLNATLKRASEIVDTAVAQAEKYNVPRKATLALLTQAEGLFDDMAAFGRPTRELRFRKALMLIEFARNYEILGDTAKEFARAKEAYDLLAGLAGETPDDPVYQGDLAVAYGEIGDVLVHKGDLAGALKSYQAELAIMERLAKSDPGNALWEHDLSVSYNTIGDVQVAQGDLAGALKSYQASLAIAERLAKSDPGNAGWQRDLAVSYERVGDVDKAQGDLAGALKSYQASLAIIERLAKSDPGNADWQRDLSVSYERVGDVQVAQGALPDALKSYQASLAIRERLAKSDPGNAEWQRDLSVSYGEIGDVQVAQGDLAGALKSYQASLAIFEHLAKSDPGNALWEHDLSVSYDRVGDVGKAQGHLPEALKSYQASLAIRERLAKSDPGNAGWQRGLAVSFSKLADVYQKSSDTAKALEALRQGQAIMARLTKLSPDNADWKHNLAWFDAQIAALTK